MNPSAAEDPGHYLGGNRSLICEYIHTHAGCSATALSNLTLDSEITARAFVCVCADEVATVWLVNRN